MKKSIYEIIAENIIFYMNKVNVSKEEVSNESDIKIRRLNNILSNKGKIRVEEAHRIAVALGVDITDLLDNSKSV